MNIFLFVLHGRTRKVPLTLARLLAPIYLPIRLRDIIVWQETMYLWFQEVMKHGTPILVDSEREGINPREFVARYHHQICEVWDRLGMSWDLYTETGTENHYRITQDFFLTLYDKGYIFKGSVWILPIVLLIGASCPIDMSKALAHTAGIHLLVAINAITVGEHSIPLI